MLFFVDLGTVWVPVRAMEPHKTLLDVYSGPFLIAGPGNEYQGQGTSVCGFAAEAACPGIGLCGPSAQQQL